MLGKILEACRIIQKVPFLCVNVKGYAVLDEQASNRGTVHNGILADETGEIKIAVWRKAINSLKHSKAYNFSDKQSTMGRYADKYYRRNHSNAVLS